MQTLIQQNYLTGDAPGVAYAELQQQIKELIATAGGVVLSTQLVQEPQDEDESAEKIIVRVRAQGESYALQKMIQLLEARKPLLFFEKLSISAPVKIKPDSAELLDIRFDVYGYFWKEAS
ncbi:MAG: type II secretion system protein GspM [Candidatus Thiodiazotropha sp. 6PLUC5]